MSGVPVTITVTAGGGSITNAPAKTTAPSTSVGTWKLGNSIGLNSLTITVGHLTPLVVSVTSLPGAPAKVVATTPATLTGVVGEPVAGPLSVSLRDAFDNVITNGVVLTVTVTGGGSSVPSVTTDGAGAASVPSWTLGTVKGTQTLAVSNGTAAATFSVAAAAGAIQSLSVLAGNNQSGLGGTPLPQPVVVAPVDQYGNRLDNQVANFSVASGGGKLKTVTAPSASDGTITMPVFTLGRSAVPQSVLASIGSQSVFVSATVISSYSIDVRLWGPPMTPAQQLLFTNAAARIRGAVVGSIPTIDATGADPADCNVTGVPVLAENVPGVIIYASVQSIDGAGSVLARAGPCFIRDAPDYRTVVGVMEFDVADLDNLSNNGNLQDVITHEMLHVVGIGTFWDDKGLLSGFNTVDVAYTGTGGVNGCQETGGLVTCTMTVPVENTGGAGTRNSHWRETTFGSELMTGYANNGSMPLSVMTVRALGDLGYTINPAAADPYQFGESLRASPSVSPLTPIGLVWEQGLPSRPRTLSSRRRTVAPGGK